jgi:integrase
LQPTELRTILEAAPLWLRSIIALAAATGMRRPEILRLRWLDIDLNGKRILLLQTTNGDGRIVYLNQLAVTAIESLAMSDQTKTDADGRRAPP